uniref:MULE transposase domain-containing protein n=1 Tax=Cacopsylla melanoneura TaxID=428564 RepID=A0A8D8X8E6_9HEMI
MSVKTTHLPIIDKKFRKPKCKLLSRVQCSHGVSQYENMRLLNIMICDQNNKGWPVGHLITNSMTSVSVGLFFKAIKTRIESYGQCFNINCVITDDDSSLINGINDVMRSEIKHILCQWHLDNSFKDNIRSKCDRNKFDIIYTDLKAVVLSKTIEEFDKLVSGFTTKHKDETIFLDYLNSYYMHRREKWAMCFRKDLKHGNVHTLWSLFTTD